MFIRRVLFDICLSVGLSDSNGWRGHSVVRVEKGVEKKPFVRVEQEVSVYFFVSSPRR